jgi:hypothetical protein
MTKGSDAGMLELVQAHRCRRFSLNSAEKPPNNGFSRQKCRHVSSHGKPNRGFSAGISRVPPTGFEPVISCVKGSEPVK